MAIDLQGGDTGATRAPRSDAGSAGRGVLSAADRRFFTERLALLLETGTPLHTALQTLARQSRSRHFREVVEQIHDAVTGGSTFGQALARHGADFPATYVNLVAAAERGGFVDEVLRHLAEMDERNARMRSSVLSSMFYPGFLMLFSVVVVVFVLTSVFPRFAPMFAGIGDQLPITTRVLMELSDLLRHQWPFLLGGAGALGVVAWRWVVSEVGGSAIDRAQLAVPVLRDLFAQFYLSKVLRVLGLSMQHGVGLVEALHSCHGLVRNRHFTAFLHRLELDVQEGRGITPAFERASFVPEMVQQMIATGEESARLPQVMRRVADFYEQEFLRRLGVLSKLVEPVMLLVMGAVVGLLVSSLILPIFKLSAIAR